MNTKFNFRKLDATTRQFMIEEIEKAQTNDQLYFSTRFTALGHAKWPTWLLDAARENNEHWLAYVLETSSAMKDLEFRSKPSGGYTDAHVPDTAAETMAEGQFNRFYIAAICRRAIASGHECVVIYRAKESRDPRQESRLLEGTQRNAQQLLEEVRNVDKSLKCNLLRPNSGLSVDLVV